MSSSVTEALEAPLDLRERGRAPGGVQTSLDRRLYFQLAVFSGCHDATPLVRALDEARLDAVLYEDVHDPRGVGLLTYAEDPAFFTGPVREVLNAPPFAGLRYDRSYAMFGRTYSIGYEPDLEETLITRPRSRVLAPEWPWAVWYPLRRNGAFERLPAEEQRAALMEHGSLGRRFAEGGHAFDIRLACHGLDPNDNDFLVGLVGPSLHPLSALVQAMRHTKQTSMYLQSLGPFFVGRAIRQGLPT